MAGSRPTIWFISERAEWIRHTLSRLPNRVCTANIVVHGWRSLSGDPRATPRLLLWDLSDWQSHHQSIMRRYAGRFYSVASVVSIESGARSGEAALSCLIGLGYTRVVVSEPRETSNLPALVSDLLESAVYLLPGVVRSLGTANYRLARAYAAILAEPAVARTGGRLGPGAGLLGPPCDRGGAPRGPAIPPLGDLELAAFGGCRRLGVKPGPCPQPERGRAALQLQFGKIPQSTLCFSGGSAFSGTPQ